MEDESEIKLNDLDFEVFDYDLSDSEVFLSESEFTDCDSDALTVIQMRISNPNNPMEEIRESDVIQDEVFSKVQVYLDIFLNQQLFCIVSSFFHNCLQYYSSNIIQTKGLLII